MIIVSVAIITKSIIMEVAERKPREYWIYFLNLSICIESSYSPFLLPQFCIFQLLTEFLSCFFTLPLSSWSSCLFRFVFLLICFYVSVNQRENLTRIVNYNLNFINNIKRLLIIITIPLLESPRLILILIRSQMTLNPSGDERWLIAMIINQS